MAKEKLMGPLRTPPGDSLGGEQVSLPPAKSAADPLGYIKTGKK